MTYLLHNNNDWWEAISDLAREVPYGELREAISKIPELSILNNEDELINKLENNTSAWGIYRSWLKINESNKRSILKSSKILSKVLESNIVNDNIEHFKLVLGRIGTVPLWNTETNIKLHNNLKDLSLNEWFSWELMHTNTETSAKYPWNTILIKWCYQVQKNEILPSKDDVAEIQSKKWNTRARCLIAGSILKSISSIYEKEELWNISRWASKEITGLAESLLTDVDAPMETLANMLLTKAMSAKDNKQERKIDKISADMLKEIEFTLDW